MKHRSRTNHDDIILFIASIMAGALLAFLFSVATASPAKADQPYGGCQEAGRYPNSEGAQHCRDHGWTVKRGLVVTPNRVLSYYDLPSCRYEDGSGQQRPCGWNVVEGNGNGHGRAFIAITRPNGKERFIMLRICDVTGCHPLVR